MLQSGTAPRTGFGNPCLTRFVDQRLEDKALVCSNFKDVRLARIPLFKRTVDSKKYRIERQDYFGIDLLAYKASLIGQD